MAITDYATLIDAVKKWTARGDSAFAARLDDFIALAEERIYNGCGEAGDPIYSAPLRNDTIETTGTLTAVSGEVEPPTGFLGARKIARETDTWGLEYLPPERFHVMNALSPCGLPAYYTFEDGVLKVTPQYDGDLEMTYWAKTTALTSTATTNALLTNHPNAYLEAVLFEAFSFIRNEPLALAHLAKLRGIIAALNGSASQARARGAKIAVRVRRPIP